ncbi:gp182 [Bacillus phage W.Ph.]|uniref:Gp182 n=1 Tax=Bacillus phage W.Ph. TaxID=764595 RepID=G9B1T3_9CAUD|nr:gp182 [Bacillus phage W.Ph.]ADH03328.1 gp182 [Bacillus phage W.Ph.]
MIMTDRIQKGEELVIINTNSFNRKFKKVMYETVIVTDVSEIESGVVECMYNGIRFADELQNKLILPLLILKRKNQLNDDEYDMFVSVNKGKLMESKSKEIALTAFNEQIKRKEINTKWIIEMINTIAGLYNLDKEELGQKTYNNMHGLIMEAVAKQNKQGVN